MITSLDEREDDEDKGDNEVAEVTEFRAEAN